MPPIPSNTSMSLPLILVKEPRKSRTAFVADEVLIQSRVRAENALAHGTWGVLVYTYSRSTLVDAFLQIIFKCVRVIVNSLLLSN